MLKFQPIIKKTTQIIDIIVGLLPQHIKQSKGLKRYARNTAWLLTEKVIRLSLALWIFAWVARYLGPSDFGLLNYALSFVALFSAIASMGMDGILIRELTLRPSDENKLLGSSFILKLIGSAAAFMLTVTLSLLIESDNDIRLILVLASFSLLVHPLMVFEFYFRSIVRSEYYAWSMIIALLFSAFLRVFFICNAFPVVFFSIVPAFELLMTSIFLLVFYLRQGKHFLQWCFNSHTLNYLFMHSWPLIFSGAMISIYMRIDQVMIQKMLNTQAVGFYSAAVRLSEAWYFIPVVICQSLLPSIVNTRNTDRTEYKKRLLSLFQLMVLISLAVAISTTFLADHLIQFLYGAKYSPSAIAFKIHIWAGIFVSIGVAGANLLLAENYQRYFLFNVTIGAITNVLANFFLINQFSYYGAAIATVISYFLSSYLSLAFLPKTRPYFFLLSQSFLIYRFFLKGSTDLK